VRPWQRMVVIGDSVAAGVTEPVPGYAGAGFADQVAAALAATHTGRLAYRNLGVRDARLADVARDQLPAALAFRPDLAIVVAGGNDALGRRYDAEGIRAGLVGLVAPLALSGALVVTIGLFDLARSGLLPGEVAEEMARRFDELDAITKSVAATFGAVHVDTHHHPRAADPSIFASDRMHANARGHAIAAEAIMKALTGISVSMATKNHGSSVKDDKTYEGLRKSGASKEKAARVANAKAGGGSPSRKGGKAASYEDQTKDQLMKRAAEVGIDGRSKMDKGELIDALRNH
jgi:lysophospholipase L1-like esterase